jgi:hypothetical protein
MKRITTLVFFLIVSFFYLISCKSSDIQPNTSTALKSISVDFVSLKGGNSKSKTTFSYTGSDITKATFIDSSFSGSTVDISSITSNYTYVNKILAKVVYESKAKSFLFQGESNIVKMSNIYDITSKSGTTQGITQIEVNANDQIVKYKDVKTISQDFKGVTSEAAGRVVIRYEYDTKGNLIKVYTNQNSPKEYLFIEMTYDSNPNVYGALKWVYSGRMSGRIGNTLPLGESKNNPITIKSYTPSGVTEDNYAITYVYDKNTSYPVSSVWTGKATNGQVLSTYKYNFVY